MNMYRYDGRWDEYTIMKTDKGRDTKVGDGYLRVIKSRRRVFKGKVHV